MNTRGTLLFEHFPHALDSTVGGATGGLLVVEHSGDVLLVPFGASFEDRYVGMPLPVAAEQLPNSGALGRISCTDVELRFEPSAHRIAQLRFAHGAPPRRVQLSGDRRLLLVLDVELDGVAVLAVYRVATHPRPRLELLHAEAALGVVDACFAPDSRALVLVPSRRPTRLVVMPLRLTRAAGAVPRVVPTVCPPSAAGRIAAPLRRAAADLPPDVLADTESAESVESVESADGGANGTAAPSTHVRAPPTSDVPLHRIVDYPGAACVIGPAVDALGRTHYPRHVQACGEACGFLQRPPTSVDALADSDQSDDDDFDVQPFHLVTWSDEYDGSFCLWSVWRESDEHAPVYRVQPQMLVPTVRDEDFYSANENMPKMLICQMAFSRDNELMCVVRRERYSQVDDCGLAMQTFRLSARGVEAGAMVPITRVYDYNSVVLQACWTQPLLLGESEVAQVVLDSQTTSVIEIAEQRYLGLFLDRVRIFNGLQAMTSLDRFRRIWLDRHYHLHLLNVLPPQLVPQAVSWGSLLDSSGSKASLPLRILAAHLGYTIRDAADDPTFNNRERVETAYRKHAKRDLWPESIEASKTQRGEALVFTDDVLCDACQRTLPDEAVGCACGQLVFCDKECKQIYARMTRED